MKKLLFLFALLISARSYSQVLSLPNGYGARSNRSGADMTQLLPSFIGVPSGIDSLRMSNYLNRAAIGYDIVGKKAYIFDPTTLAWSPINTGGGAAWGSITGSLPAQIDLRDSLAALSARIAARGTVFSFSFTNSSGITGTVTNSTSTPTLSLVIDTAAIANFYVKVRSLFTAGTGMTITNGVIATTITQYTDALARASISLTTTGSSGASTYNSSTGVFNIPTYTITGLGGVPASRTITINGTTFDLSADRSWTITAGSVTSVAMSVPTGLTVSGSPITTTGTFAVTLTSGYSIPTTSSQTNWDAAYSARLTTLSLTNLTGSFSGNTLTLATSLASLTATDATLTFSGAYNGAAARTVGINLNNPNTWTGVNTYTGGWRADAQVGETARVYEGNVGAGSERWRVDPNFGHFAVSDLYIHASSAGNFTSTVNASITNAGVATMASFIKSGGTSAQFLKADGSVDGSTYLTSAVNSVSAGYGMTCGTITGSGEVAVDSSVVEIKSANQTLSGQKTFRGGSGGTSYPIISNPSGNDPVFYGTPQTTTKFSYIQLAN